MDHSPLPGSLYSQPLPLIGWQRLFAQHVNLIRAVFRDKLAPLINGGTTDPQGRGQPGHVMEMLYCGFGLDLHGNSISMLIFNSQAT